MAAAPESPSVHIKGLTYRAKYRAKICLKSIWKKWFEIVIIIALARYGTDERTTHFSLMKGADKYTLSNRPKFWLFF